MKRAGRIIIAIVAVLVLVLVGVLVWAHMVMGGERPASLRAWRDPAVAITTTDHSLVMRPTGENAGVGLVFIPGAKVDPSAYLYKLAGIVHSGVTVVITKPTLNLAFFDTRPLSTFAADAPGVTRWFVGGHSLGGVRACQLADAPGVSGLILFGSYCANDLSASGLTVLSISGSRDGLSTPQKIADARPLTARLGALRRHPRRRPRLVRRLRRPARRQPGDDHVGPGTRRDHARAAHRAPVS